ncbi:CBS domain-containing protein [Formivibrio citricus]|uniref:CBS domain-containing protein n=1 Tax=Formivibrio citricus TaxID=83765 RepID=A0A1I5DHI3_9NEIS|nr:CBS domain-containing protein [Formivibrio citricus]SFN98724.1 CBS domain-containing protein [Formivibrio citricus]
MKTARQQLAEKALPVTISVSPSHTVFQALQVMAEWNIGAVLVMNGNELAGIFSERDYARRVVLAGKSTATTPVSEVMSPCAFCVLPDIPVDECLALMVEKRIRYLPIQEGGKVQGLLSIEELVRATITEHQFALEQLESYIYR